MKPASAFAARAADPTREIEVASARPAWYSVGCGFLLLYLTRGVLLSAIALIIIGMFESVLHPTGATVITDVVAPATLRKHFALTRVTSDVGRTVGPAIGAVLAFWSLGLVFFASAMALLCGTVVVALCLSETRQPSRAISPNGGEEEDEEGRLLTGSVDPD